MARTMEVKSLNVPKIPMIHARNTDVMVLVNDPKDSARTIWVVIPCAQAVEMGKKITEMAEGLQEKARLQSFNARIAKLQAIADDDMMPESLRMSTLEQIENLKAEMETVF